MLACASAHAACRCGHAAAPKAKGEDIHTVILSILSDCCWGQPSSSIEDFLLLFERLPISSQTPETIKAWLETAAVIKSSAATELPYKYPASCTSTTPVQVLEQLLVACVRCKADTTDGQDDASPTAAPGLNGLAIALKTSLEDYRCVSQGCKWHMLALFKWAPRRPRPNCYALLPICPA